MNGGDKVRCSKDRTIIIWSFQVIVFLQKVFGGVVERILIYKEGEYELQNDHQEVYRRQVSPKYNKAKLLTLRYFLKKKNFFFIQVYAKFFKLV